MNKQKMRLKEREKKIQEVIADLKESNKEAENPYYRHMGTCDDLIAYLHRMRINLGQVHVEQEDEHTKAEMIG